MPGAGSSSYSVTTGPGPHIDDLALDAEILQHAFERFRILLDLLGGRDETVAGLGGGQKIERRQHIAAAACGRGFLDARLALGARRGLFLFVFLVFLLGFEVRLVHLFGDGTAAAIRDPAPRDRAPERSMRRAAVRRVTNRERRAAG